MRQAIAILVVAGMCGALGLTASRASREQRASQTAAGFDARVLGWVAAGRYGQVYAALHPAQQKVISRLHYVACLRTAVTLARQNFGFDASTARVRSAREYGPPATTVISGTQVVTRRAIQVRLLVSMAVRGRRTTMPYGVEANGNVADWVVSVRGRWRYIAVSVADYLRPHCGREIPQPVVPGRVTTWAKDEGFSANAAAVA